MFIEFNPFAGPGRTPLVQCHRNVGGGYTSGLGVPPNPRRLAVALVFLAIVGAVLFVKPGQRANLKSLYARRRWFELRDAVEASHWQAPALYRAAVAYAFHDLDAAVKLALEAVRTSLDRGDVIRARYVLADAYSWSGRYTEALAELNAIGSSTDLSDRALYSAAARFPPQAVIRGAVSTIKWDEAPSRRITIPVQVNGKTAHYEIDTGADFCSISEMEAARLGLKTYAMPGFRGEDGSGVGFEVRLAVADTLTVGGFELEHVIFQVRRGRDSLLTGVLGLRVLLAFQTVTWNHDGSTEIGAPPARRNLREANLCFDGPRLLARASYQKSGLYMFLDSGANETTFLPRFAADFPELVRAKAGQGTQRIEGAGGTIEVPIAVLPEVALDLGNASVKLNHGTLRLKDPNGWEYHLHGASDLLKAQGAAIDFGAMQLKFN